MGEKISLKLKKPSGKESIDYPEYPTLYLSDVKLPVSKEDVGNIINVKLTLKFVRYGMDNSTKKDHTSYDFAVMDIQFLNDTLENRTTKRLQNTFKKE